MVSATVTLAWMAREGVVGDLALRVEFRYVGTGKGGDTAGRPRYEEMQDHIVPVIGPGCEVGEGRSLWMRTRGDMFGSIDLCLISARPRGVVCLWRTSNSFE